MSKFIKIIGMIIYSFLISGINYSFIPSKYQFIFGFFIGGTTIMGMILRDWLKDDGIENKLMD